MAETTRAKANGQGGDPNTTTSDNKSGSKTTTGSTSTGKQPEEISKSNLVEQGSPAEVTVEIQTDTKEEKKAVPKTTPKKRKPPAKKTKAKNEKEQIKDIQNLLEGVFMVASLKAGSHWQLSEEESNQIATPLSRILDRYDLLSKASEVSDPVALVVATATIIFPRVMVSKMSATQKKADTLKKNGVISDVKERNNASDRGSDSGPAKTTDQSNDGQFIKSIHNEIQTGI